MLPLIICGVLLSITSHADCMDQEYIHYPEAHGRFKLHSEPANWIDAFETCYNEGAFLASPLNEDLRGVMQSIMGKNGQSSSYFIGANAKYTSGLYVSVEALPLTRMPVGDMYDVLNREQGECLSMNTESITVVSCSNSLPYLCYKPDSECGTTDKEYQFEPSTGSCYKLHRELKTWRDANTVCIQEGGYLTILNNELEMQLIANMIPDWLPPGWAPGWQGLYIGLHDWTHKGRWLTNEARPLDRLFNNWDENQPDQFSIANCATIDQHKKLDNIACSYEMPFVCEKDPKYIVYSEYVHYPEAHGRLKLHSEPANWTEAFETCYNEGAFLASPLVEELRGVMQSIMAKNGQSSSYLIGANAKYTSGLYVSVEGLPLTRMPVGDMYDVLNREQGECLSMNTKNITVVSCSNSLPYLCYKPDSECGTTDKEYQFEPSTGNCYKLHRELKTWRDANTVCIQEGGYLTILNNELEMQLIANMIPDWLPPGWTPGWQGLYIGLHDWTHKGRWLTNEARPLDRLFNNWDENQPDQFSIANCATIDQHKKLDNIACSYEMPFVCEKDPKYIVYAQEQSETGTERPS